MGPGFYKLMYALAVEFTETFVTITSGGAVDHYTATCLFCLRGHYCYKRSLPQRGEYISLPSGEEVRERRGENRVESLISALGPTQGNGESYWSLKLCSWKVKKPMVILEKKDGLFEHFFGLSFLVPLNSSAFIYTLLKRESFVP